MSAAPAIEAAEQAAEAVRALNHATITASEFCDPADVYRLLGELGVMAQRLPQALAQLERILGWQTRSVVMGLDDGTPFDNVDVALAAARENLRDGVEHAHSLTDVVLFAQQAISGVYQESQ